MPLKGHPQKRKAAWHDKVPKRPRVDPSDALLARMTGRALADVQAFRKRKAVIHPKGKSYGDLSEGDHHPHDMSIEVNEDGARVKLKHEVKFQVVEVCDKTTRIPLGSGSQAKVFREECGDKTLAVKVFNKKKHYDREIGHLTRLSIYPRCSKYIGCLYGGVSKGARHSMYMELGTDRVWHYSKGRSYWNRPLTRSEFKEIALPLLEGLALIHELDVAHMDIKPENMILVKSQIKYVDFGLACRVGERDYLSGTIAYLPPESIEFDGKGDLKCGTRKGRKSLLIASTPGNQTKPMILKNGGFGKYFKAHDVFALAVSMHELIHNKSNAHLHMNSDDLVANKVYNIPKRKRGFATYADETRPSDIIPYKFKQPGSWNPIYDILDQMMHPVVEKRLTAHEALERFKQLWRST